MRAVVAIKDQKSLLERIAQSVEQLIKNQLVDGSTPFSYIMSPGGRKMPGEFRLSEERTFDIQLIDFDYTWSFNKMNSA